MEKMWDILASLYYGKATFNELKERDFLKNTSEYGITLMLRYLEKEGYIKYNKKDEYIAIKKTAEPELRRRGYFE